MTLCDCLWLFVTGCDWLWLYVAVCGCLWLFVVVCGCMWLFVVVCGCLRLFVVVCGCLWLLSDLPSDRRVLWILIEGLPSLPSFARSSTQELKSPRTETFYQVLFFNNSIIFITLCLKASYSFLNHFIIILITQLSNHPIIQFFNYPSKRVFNSLTPIDSSIPTTGKTRVKGRMEEEGERKEGRGG